MQFLSFCDTIRQKEAVLLATKWTDDQKAAIVSRNQNLLLSAAAGSGKTAVLVARIVERLTEKENPIDADRLLVVTFTNAAAAEMRERILASLTKCVEENPKDSFLAKQLSLVKKAQITTIDAFCIQVLRTYFVAANLPPDFQISDPAENTIMRKEVLEKVIAELYDDAEFSDDFLLLLEAHTNAKANDKAFRDMVDGLYHFVMSLPNPIQWLKQASAMFRLEKSFAETTWCKTIIDEVKSTLQKVISECESMINLCISDGMDAYATFFIERKKSMEEIIQKDTYEALQAELVNLSFGRRPAYKADRLQEFQYFDYVTKKWDETKKSCKGIVERLLSVTVKEQEYAIQKTYPLMRCLSELLMRFIQRFSEEKLSRSKLDFHDCEHMCLQLLTNEDGTPTPTAIEIKNQFDEIYIDEYQDTSRLQEAIFSAIKRENNLFMVGDIKQSIYRFRNTDPTLFQQKRDTFSAETDATDRKIVLSKNFRSRESVLSFVNFIFERIMSEHTGEIDYDETEKLYSGADFPEDAPNPMNVDTEVCLIDISKVKTSVEEETDDIEDIEKTELEAVYVANRIAELVDSEVQVFANGEYRKISYRDICILSRNVKSSAPVFSAVLAEHGIPCYSDRTGRFLESSEVSMMISLLSVIDNPYQDLPLLAVLRSILFHFTADDLAKIRCYDKKSSFYDAIKCCANSDSDIGRACLDFLETLELFREKARYMSVSELVMDIYQTTGFYDAQQTRINGEIRRANLRLLYDRAVAYEKTGLKGLYSFTNFLTGFSSSGGDFEAAKLLGSEQNAVSIMSIHGSKGLEFPVVILCGLENKFSTQDLQKSVLYHADIGFGPKFVDTDLRITYPFAPRTACASVLRHENEAEEMRILYVALTRAKEKLILVGAVKDLAKKINACAGGGKERRIKANAVMDGKSYLDWMLTALLNHPDCEALRNLCDITVPVIPDESHVCVNIVADARFLFAQKEKLEQDEKTIIESEDIKKLVSFITYQYPYAVDTVLPPKITVTELKRKLAVQEEDSVYLYPRTVTLTNRSKTLTSAQIGTAYHTVMQHLALSDDVTTLAGVKAQIEEIVAKGMLSEEEAAVIRCEQIAAFFTTKTGQQMLHSKRVLREVMFGILRPANTLLPELTSDKEIMLQGTIDCVVETEEGLIIVDYKTDRGVSLAQLADRYRIQLECYKMAAETMYHKPVIRKVIYSFSLGEETEV